MILTCKRILNAYFQESEYSISCDDEYDYEFLFNNSDSTKLLSYSLIVNILNKEINRINIDVNDLRRKYLLTLHQKLSLLKSQSFLCTFRNILFLIMKLRCSFFPILWKWKTNTLIINPTQNRLRLFYHDLFWNQISFSTW